MTTQQTIRQSIPAAEAEGSVLIPRTLTVRELADLLDETPVTIIKTLMTNGIMADVTKTLDYGTAGHRGNGSRLRSRRSRRCH